MENNGEFFYMVNLSSLATRQDWKQIGPIKCRITEKMIQTKNDRFDRITGEDRGKKYTFKKYRYVVRYRLNTDQEWTEFKKATS